MGELLELLKAALTGVAVLGVKVRPESPEASDSRLGAVLTEPGGRARVDLVVTTEPDGMPGGLCWGRVEPLCMGWSSPGSL